MLRTWSPDNVIAQIDRLVRDYGVTNIKIPDEMFVLNRRHVIGICDRIIERGYRLNIWAYARVDSVQDEVLAKLAQAGFTWLGLGIESGSQHVRDGVEKGRFVERDIVATVDKIRSYGIHVAANYIFGLPDDTMESMRATLDLDVYKRQTEGRVTRKGSVKMGRFADCDVVILCGGLGTRLQSVVADRPKSMTEIHGRPFVACLVEHFLHHGTRRFIFSTGYKGDMIEDWFGRHRGGYETCLLYTSRCV